MKLKMCNCKQCKHGRKNDHNRYMVTHLKRAARHKVKQALQAGDWENLPEAVWIPWTDVRI